MVTEQVWTSAGYVLAVWWVGGRSTLHLDRSERGIWHSTCDQRVGWSGVASLCAQTRDKPSSARYKQRLSDGPP